MAYRRRHGIQRASTFKEESRRPADDDGDSPNSMSSSSLGGQAIRASAARRDSSAYANSSFHSSFKDRSKFYQTSYQPAEGSPKMDNPRFRKGLDALATSLNHIGDTIGNALEEGRTIVEGKSADIIQETKKMQSRRREANSGEPNQVSATWQQSTQSAQPQMQTHQADQIKASRDVAMATAAKAKLLLRELKTVKAELAFAKQRCSQLEEENRILREARDKGANPADDDMIRGQLETLLAEKARLATENTAYARENRFLREIVEYHQLTMQDVVYVDEGIEEVTEVGGPRLLSASPSVTSLQSLETSPAPSRTSSAVAKELLALSEMQKPTTDVPDSQETSCAGPALTDVPLQGQQLRTNPSALSEDSTRR